MAKPGPKPRIADTSRIEELISKGCNDNEIAELCGLNPEKMKRSFSDLLRKKRNELKLELRGKQVEIAKAGDRTMLIWLGKQLLGQTDRADVTSGGDPIRIVVEKVG